MKNVSVLLSGILGGFLGILIGAGELLLLLLFGTSSHIPGSWLEGGLVPPEAGALLFILLGVLGTIASLSYSEKRRGLARVILLCGLLGFPVGYASGSYLVGGWIYWIIPGILLTVAGLISMATPERIASSLPLLKNDKSNIRFLGYALYSGLFIAGLIIIVGGLFTAGLMQSIPDNSPEGNATQDQRDFENAAVAQSMGLPNESLKSYDRILARNQSNVRAWYLKGYTLSRLGRYDEAIICYDRALEIDPKYYQAEYARNEARKDLKSSNMTGERIGS